MLKHSFTIRRGLLWSLGLSAMVLVAWAFPAAWYRSSSASSQGLWLRPSHSLSNWTFEARTLDSVVERVLVADRVDNGSFVARDGKVVRVFCATRYKDSSNEVGLFVHTPDRCWTEAGWTLESANPETSVFAVAGLKLVLERRVFRFGQARELVYFAGLIGGQPLPYRLDHNLMVGSRAEGVDVAKSTRARLFDNRYWGRVWNAFVAREQVNGPKQFLRISTPIQGKDFAEAEAAIQAVLDAWLQPVDYSSDRVEWQNSRQR